MFSRRRIARLLVSPLKTSKRIFVHHSIAVYTLSLLQNGISIERSDPWSAFCHSEKSVSGLSQFSTAFLTSRFSSGLYTGAGRGLAVAGECRGGGRPDADRDDQYEASTCSQTRSTRGSSHWINAHWARRWATPGSSCLPTGARRTRRRATPSCSSGTGHQPQGAAAAAAAGVDGAVAGRRHGGALLECRA